MYDGPLNSTVPMALKVSMYMHVKLSRNYNSLTMHDTDIVNIMSLQEKRQVIDNAIYQNEELFMNT